MNQEAAIFEANCLEEKPARIASQVLRSREPCLVTTLSSKERGVLVPFAAHAELVASHPRVIDSLLKDLKKPGTDMAMYCLQIGYSNERDAFRFLDEHGKPTLAMVGVRRFQRWQEKAGAAAPGAGTRAKRTAAVAGKAAVSKQRKPKVGRTASSSSKRKPAARPSKRRPRG